MLARGIVAICTALALSPAAIAAELPSAPAGLAGVIDDIGSGRDLGERPGLRLTHSFRLQVGASDRLDAVAHGAGPMRTMLLDKRRTRRLVSVIDFYPLAESGFHLSAGMRKLPRPAKRVAASGIGATAFDLSGLSATTALGTRSSVARRSPMVAAGWTGMVAPDVQLGFTAGAAEQHGKTYAGGMGLAAAGSTRRWSRIGEVAQVNLAMRF